MLLAFVHLGRNANTRAKTMLKSLMLIILVLTVAGFVLFCSVFTGGFVAYVFFGD
jgi:hypothetical protein